MAGGTQSLPARQVWRRMARLAGVLLLLFGVGAVVLNSPIGHRLVAYEIAKLTPSSGLKIRIGRIEGSLYGKAILQDVTLSDPDGAFLQLPRVDLDWRPFHWFTSGLDIRELVTHRGTLLRRPALRKGSSGASTLPNFDIRLDRFQIDNLTLASGISGPGTHKVNILAQAMHKQESVYLKADGQLGRQDRFHLLLDSRPRGNRFKLDANYVAPRDGVIAALVGANAGYRGRVSGKGTWSDWAGSGQITRNGKRFAMFKLTNRSGRYTLTGAALPQGALTGIPAQLAGERVAYSGNATLERNVLDGQLILDAGGLLGTAKGAIDLGHNSIKRVVVNARLKDGSSLGKGTEVEGAQLDATIDGPFRNLAVAHTIEVARFVDGTTQVEHMLQRGTARFDGREWTLPIDGRVGRAAVGVTQFDPLMIGGQLHGTVRYADGQITSRELAIAFPDATARFTLAGDVTKGMLHLAGPIAASGVKVDGLGTVDAQSKIDFRAGAGRRWTLAANVRAQASYVTNAAVVRFAGPTLTLSGGVAMADRSAITLRALRLDSPRLTLTADGTISEGVSTFKGQGHSTEFGAFTVDGSYASVGPRAVLVFANPVPAAGLRNVRLALAPIEGGVGIDTTGGSTLGPFTGKLALLTQHGSSSTLTVRQFKVWKTTVAGQLALGDQGADGDLALHGGGLSGTIGFSSQQDGQAIAIDLAAHDATFAGLTPITVARATVEANILTGARGNRIEGSVYSKGIGYGRMFIGRLAASAKLDNGKGTVNASVAGRRGSRFALQLTADASPGRYAVAARGDYVGQPISLPRRAVLARQLDGSWRLLPTQIDYAGGSMIAQGQVDRGAMSARLQMADMPLSLSDIMSDALDLGGKVSGDVNFMRGGDGIPVGNASIKVKGLTRSGLLLTSRPVDLDLVADLGRSQLSTRAVIHSADGKALGRLQGRVAGMPETGNLYDRLRAGQLFAQLRYAGSADALWRLAAINTFDLTGPVAAATDISGTIDNPRVRGSLASDDLRVRSGLSGTDLRKVAVRGIFAGSQLRLTSFSGDAPNGGSVNGSGTIDFSGLSATHGPQLDLRLAAKRAALIDAAGLSATVTGPLRIVSGGQGGTIAGRLAIERASWQLGQAAAVSELPQIETREINRPADAAPESARVVPWRYMIDAKADDGIDVRGLGLDSEWGADVRVRGTTADPRIGGAAKVVRGTYSFASTRFDLNRGRITFDESTPIDPRLDIVAETKKDGLDVTAKVQGSALHSQITFSSNPSLPEEEILSRLLFGDSITQLSATDVLQLGAAVASLHGGGGLDPINQLRSAIGLDRLRIVSADPTIGRGTGVAVGKNIGRKAYVEIVTDGRGYSATDTEFRITSWLSLLGSVSTIGRSSVVAQASKDY